MTDLPFHHPDRPAGNFRPLKALHHFRKLIANKEDTEQVFHIVAALRGRRFRNHAHDYWANAQHNAALCSGPRLHKILDDHDALKKLAAGTVGRAYVAFMEKEGLSAAGLQEEFDKFAARDGKYDDVLERYGDRLRDMHDLFHILTGYGRDALGEQCVLAFTYSQNHNLGIGFIAYAAGWELKRKSARFAPIFSAINEGKKIGAEAANLLEENILLLLNEPLDAARKRLNIRPAVMYAKAHDAMRSAGVNPYDLLAVA
jgi:ubiquinone biosynthesis protein COQ4